MKATPHTTEGWERFWLIVLGTVQLVLVWFCFRFGGHYFVAKVAGEWLDGLFAIVTTLLFIYTIVLGYRGRVLLALLSFILSLGGLLFITAIG
jgi:hypothetical protein